MKRFVDDQDWPIPYLYDEPQDVARALGISPGHVAVLLHRAKANLVVCMTRAAAPDTCTTGR
jgi:hypothetical protein